MNIANLFASDHWFQVLQTSSGSQTAVMTLAPGKATGAEAEAHEASEQILLVVEGALSGEIGSEKLKLQRGDVVVIPKGTKHRFANDGQESAVTFNVYVPPEYAPDEKD